MKVAIFDYEYESDRTRGWAGDILILTLERYVSDHW